MSTTTTEKPKPLGIPLTATTSSQVKLMGYSPEHKTLAIRFKVDGPLYELPNFGPESWALACKAKSLGNHYTKVIKPRYTDPSTFRKFDVGTA